MITNGYYTPEQELLTVFVCVIKIYLKKVL